MADEFKHKDVGTSLTEQEWTGVGSHILDQQAIGDLVYADTTTQLLRLGIGNAGDLLNVAGGKPAWVQFSGSTNIDTLGTIVTGTWNASVIGEVYGGTGQSTWTAGDIPYASAANTLSKLGIGTQDQQIRVNALGFPEWFTPSASGASVGLAMAFAIVF